MTDYKKLWQDVAHNEWIKVEHASTDYKVMWQNSVEEVKWLTEQNERLKGNKKQNPTLRDQFAMAALTGLLANNVACKTAHLYAYEIADNIMKERVK